jgi:hypothetical protein
MSIETLPECGVSPALSMRCLALAFFSLLFPAVLSSAPAQISVHALLEQEPALPGTALGAYAQWTAVGDALTPGTAFKAFSESRVRQKTLIQQQVQAAAASPPPQLAQSMAYASSPDGQATMRAMAEAQDRGASDAEMVALASKMRGQAPRLTPVAEASARDVELKSRILSNLQLPRQVQIGMQKIQDQEHQIDRRWDAEIAALEKEELRTLAALPPCPDLNHSEAGPEPSKIAVRDIKLRFADQRIAATARYAPEYQSLALQMKNVLQPAVDHGDSALAAWAMIESPLLKYGTASQAGAAAIQALDAMGDLETFIETHSKTAALTVSARKKLERDYAQARGCSDKFSSFRALTH